MISGGSLLHNAAAGRLAIFNCAAALHPMSWNPRNQGPEKTAGRREEPSFHRGDISTTSRRTNERLKKKRGNGKVNGLTGSWTDPVLFHRQGTEPLFSLTGSLAAVAEPDPL